MTSASPSVIYLDQNIWSQLASASAGTSLAQLRRFLGDGANSGKLLCPVSLPHVAEVAKWQHPDRARVVALMSELSQGVCVPFIYHALAIEARGGVPELGLIVTVMPGLAPLTVDYLRSMPPEQALTVTLDGLSGAADFLATIERFDASTNSLLEGRVMPKIAAGGPLSKFYLELLRQRLADAGRKTAPGDGRDLLHAVHSWFAGSVVLERSHRALVHQAGHPGVFRGKMPELQQWLERRVN